MSLRNLWLIFAQSATVALGVLFVVATLRPEWLPLGSPTVVAFREAPREEPYGTVAVFEDLYGNGWDLLQLKR